MVHEDNANACYWIVARDKAGLLIAMMRKLAGNAHISFEGDLSRCTFPAELRPSTKETDILARNTLEPRQDFLVVSLEHETIQPVLDVILPNNRYLRDIIHIQIEKDGVLQFGSYDNFHKECIVAYSAVPTALLDQMTESGVISSWTVAPPNTHRWHD